MNFDELTQGQKNAILSNGSVLVSAAAGSGKTSVLTEKVVHLLADENNPCSADRLLVVTFTNAAAAEMKARIEQRLNEECAANPHNKELLRQKILLSHSSVCTIDSFCLDLVREHFYDLQIDPDFSIVNGGVFEEWKRNAAAQVMNEAFLSDPVEYKKVLDALNSKFGDDAVKNNILAIYRFTRALQDPSAWLENAAAEYENITELSETKWAEIVAKKSISIIEDQISVISAALERIERNYSERNMPKLVAEFYSSYSSFRDVFARMLAESRGKKWDAVVAALGGVDKISENGMAALKKSDDIDNDSARIISFCQDELEKSKKALEKFYYEKEEIVLEQIKREAGIIRFLVNGVKRLEELLFERCKEHSVFTFDMIEHLALSLLKSPVGAEISQRFDWVLVDEYQDVNELQGTIFRLLSRDDERLFAVGDVKQSIYGFRQADPQMFLDRKDSYKPYDGENYPAKIILDANFRSRSGVCRFVNECFSALMSKEICGMDYLAEDSLDPQAKYEPKEEANVEIHVVDSKNFGTTAEAVAEYILNICDSGSTVGRKGKEKPVSFGDIAILMRGPAGHVDEYIQVFTEYGIPVSAEKEGFWETREIMTVCSALQAVNNPCDDVALLATLMAYPGGFTAEDVAELRSTSADKNAALYVSVCEAADNGNAKAADFRKAIAGLRRRAASASVASVLNDVYDWLDIFNAVRMADNGENRAANLLRLMSVAAEYEKGENADLQSFCAFAQRNMINSDDKSAMSPSGSNAVRIMSIHKSKGLQFPVCILAEADTQFNVSDGTAAVAMHEKAGIAVNYNDLEECLQYKSFAKRAVSAAISEKVIAEEMRLLYVAMTRAEDKLVVFAKSKDPDKTISDIFDSISFGRDYKHFSPVAVSRTPSYARWLIMCLYDHPFLHEATAKYRSAIKEKSDEMNKEPVKLVIHTEKQELSKKEDIVEHSADERVVEEIRRRVEYVYPYSDLLDIAAKSSVTSLAKQESATAEFSDTPSFLSGTMLTPAQRGTALHKFMQFCDFGRSEISVEEEANRLEDMEFISETERAALDISALEKFFAGNLYARIKKAKTMWREQRFLSKLLVGEIEKELGEKFPEENIVIQGAADCVFVESDQLVVLDFKTDRVKTEQELAERYAAQLDIYGKVFAEIYDMPVKEKIIYSFKLGKEISL
ncbi:MAG: UvrD-helicase domain-containing protein [Clostridia bacterium]|nr:UvrD-helicase domain-containing protein [Clostridia bacterium]